MPKLITTFEEACKVKKIDPATVLPDVSAYPQEHQKALTAAAKLFIITDVLNEGHKFNWKDYDEYKYYPWWDMNDTSSPSGFGLHAVLLDCTHSTVGSRLCFKSEELGRYAATQFEAIYRDYFTL